MKTKVLRLSELSSQGDWKKLSGGVVCFGHFNTIHPGHIRYFRAAIQIGQPLIVALEGDEQLPTFQHRSAFNEIERAEAVSSLNMIDFVVILDSGRLEVLVQQLSPIALVLGKEFERLQNERISSAIVTLVKQGGEVIYDAGETHYTSVEFFHSSPKQIEQDRWRDFKIAQKNQRTSLTEVLKDFASGRAPRILVLGDSIVDRYVACDPVGMSSEAPVVVVKEFEAQDYLGGAGIVAAHVTSLGARCDFISVTGIDKRAEFIESSLNNCGVNAYLFRDNGRPTTFKIRYMVENQKLFRVSRLKEHSIPVVIEDQIIEKIISIAPKLDGILVSDFVYGVVTPRVLDSLLRISLEYGLPVFGDLQCSSQVGNIKKFKGFHLICPTEREARIALSNHDDGVEYVANRLMKETNSVNMILKLGAEGFIVYTDNSESDFPDRQYFPALTSNPVDVAGSGDALLAAMTVGITRGLSVMQASVLACCVSAIAVNTVGNRPISIMQVEDLVFQREGNNNAV